MLHIISSLLWSMLIVFIIFYGIKFAIRLRFPHFKFKKIIFSPSENKQILFLTLAGRIGVGSIAGVALAIYLGGSGTLLWMWIITIIAAPFSFSETLLAMKYKENQNFGGPSYYIKKGLKKEKLAKVYSLIVIIAYLIGFIPIQSNTIIRTLNMININLNVVIGIIIALLIYIIIKKGIKLITKVTNTLVPIMTIIYITIAAIVLINNLNKIPTVIQNIITNAFNIKPFLSSFIPLVLIGIQRGIFANESGLGLGAIAASSSKNNNGVKSGYTQILGTYITTLIICTVTALIVLLSNYQMISIENPNGIEIALYAFNYHFKNIGSTILIICIFLFSFSTILTGHYYCQSSLKFLNKNVKIVLLTTASVFVGTITSPTIIWKSIDALVAILGIINIYTLNKLLEEIVSYYKKYDRI